MAEPLLSWSEKALRLLRRMDNFNLPGSSRTQCLKFEVDGLQVGWIPATVAPVLSRFPQVFTLPQGGAVALCASLDSYSRRSDTLHSVIKTLREENHFICLRGWREEKYEVRARYCDSSLMSMERAATSLFGVKRFGVHVNGYIRGVDGALSMWLARRSPTKQTYPGKLDNLAAGGLAAGSNVKQTLIKECQEEACIPACIAETARPVGTVSYTYEDEEGVFPESQFVFDLELPPHIRPQIGDGEVQDFFLCPIEQTKDMLVSEDFKPNSAMVLLDFLIRHSYIQPDSEQYYQELVAGLHRPF
ncbi:hypothetical protein SKAU_G00101320 [Synaphobranchus kaupii]|uniref:Nudix hydrolase domain-containing protein n=1 Tax=Synaphobranchus kaupii TaxID=118154 RepID=A0A9Q1FYA8_SYNKA|nr:hypothetical protein SKAU_G00101320 [Synaphobranchus kaupii]